MAIITLCKVGEDDIPVFQDTVTKRIYYTAGLNVDVDGAAHSYRLDNSAANGALDDIHASAGYPNEDWQNVLVTDPQNPNQPYVDPNGFCVSMTTYRWPGYPSLDRRSWVDAVAVLYSVPPGEVRALCAGVLVGCQAQITRTTDHMVVHAVAADLSGDTIGEASQAAAQQFDPSLNARNGDDNQIYLFEFFPDQAALINGVQYLLQPA